MLFGWRRVGEKLHFFATSMVALGTIISTFWILASNSWMQTPQGYEIVDGRVVPTDWFAIVFNPSFPYRLAHMSVAAFVSSALFVGASAAWHLLRGNQSTAVKTMFSMSLGILVFLAPLQAVIGDVHGLNTLEHQPAKIAAIEGHWDNSDGKPTPLILFGMPNMEQERTDYALEIPVLGSLILRHSLTEPIPALKDFPKEERPNSPIVFWSFRIMVGLGLLMIFQSFYSMWLRKKEHALYLALVPQVFIIYGTIWSYRNTRWLVYDRGWSATLGRVWRTKKKTRDAVSAHGDLQMSISCCVSLLYTAWCLVLGITT